VVRETAVASISLTEAAAKYVASLSQARAQQAQPSVSRFVQWLGTSRPLSSVKSVDVERFVEESTGRGGGGAKNIEEVRKFLAYLKKAGVTDANLSGAIKVKRSESVSSEHVDPNAVQMTREGLDALKAEYAELVDKRPQIAEALHLAMADKDFRENAPLDAARDQQAHVEAQIRRVEQLLKNAVVVDATTGASGTVRVGSTVRVTNLQNDQETAYRLVSPTEVNPREGKISVQSPVGKALADHVAGDEVSVNVPAGVIRLRIESVEF